MILPSRASTSVLRARPLLPSRTLASWRPALLLATKTTAHARRAYPPSSTRRRNDSANSSSVSPVSLNVMPNPRAMLATFSWHAQSCLALKARQRDRVAATVPLATSRALHAVRVLSRLHECSRVLEAVKLLVVKDPKVLP
jgi:hypothetical protein